MAVCHQDSVTIPVVYRHFFYSFSILFLYSIFLSFCSSKRNLVIGDYFHYSIAHFQLFSVWIFNDHSFPELEVMVAVVSIFLKP